MQPVIYKVTGNYSYQKEYNGLKSTTFDLQYLGWMFKTAEYVNTHV